MSKQDQKKLLIEIMESDDRDGLYEQQTSIQKEKLVVSFSGGRTSAYMSQWLKKNKSDEYEMIFVFSNTGKEREETLEFVDKCDKHFNLNLVWIEPLINAEFGSGTEFVITDFKNASRNGEPFESLIKKYGIPNKANMVCSRDLKAVPITKYAKSIGWKKYYTAIGIREDEIDRMSSSRVKNKIIYPLISMNPSNKNDVNAFWLQMPFDLNLKSYEGNCDLCWKKSFRKLQTIALENPQLTEWWIEMEQKYGMYAPEHKMTEEVKKHMPFTFYREHKSMKDIVDMSKSLKNKALDDSKQAQLSMFNLDYVVEHIDENNGCEESCEPF